MRSYSEDAILRDLFSTLWKDEYIEFCTRCDEYNMDLLVMKIMLALRCSRPIRGEYWTRSISLQRLYEWPWNKNLTWTGNEMT